MASVREQVILTGEQALAEAVRKVVPKIPIIKNYPEYAEILTGVGLLVLGSDKVGIVRQPMLKDALNVVGSNLVARGLVEKLTGIVGGQRITQALPPPPTKGVVAYPPETLF